MSERERFRRDEPVRTGPIRDFSTLYRPLQSSDNYAGSPPPSEREEVASASAPAFSGVEAAYRVIQRHFDEGRLEAEQLTNGSRPAVNSTDPLQHLLERTLRFQEEILPLVLDSLRNLVKPASTTVTDSRAPGGSVDRGTFDTSSLVIDIVSSRPIEVSLDVRDNSTTLPLATPGLHALDGSKPPLTSVTFLPATENCGRLRLRIAIPDGHPSGIYSGVVMDSVRCEARGTLTVTVKD